jgi:uncharacterized coiled-coil protein SlyX
MATQEQIIADLQKRVAALEQRANNQSVRMSTIDAHIANLDKTAKTPKLLLEEPPKPSSTDARSKQVN